MILPMIIKAKNSYKSIRKDNIYAIFLGQDVFEDRLVVASYNKFEIKEFDFSYVEFEPVDEDITEEEVRDMLTGKKYSPKLALPTFISLNRNNPPMFHYSEEDFYSLLSAFDKNLTKNHINVIATLTLLFIISTYEGIRVREISFSRAQNFETDLDKIGLMFASMLTYLESQDEPLPIEDVINEYKTIKTMSPNEIRSNKDLKIVSTYFGSLKEGYEVEC